MEAIQAPGTPTPQYLAELAAQYVQNKFRFELALRSSQSPISVATPPLLPPLMLPVPLISELDYASHVLAEAYRNPG
jgi:hypothetical protein